MTLIRDASDSYPDRYKYYHDQVSCIDRQIAELQARKYALLHGYCFAGDYSMSKKPYLDPFNLCEQV